MLNLGHPLHLRLVLSVSWQIAASLYLGIERTISWKIVQEACLKDL